MKTDVWWAAYKVRDDTVVVMFPKAGSSSLRATIARTHGSAGGRYYAFFGMKSAEGHPQFLLSRDAQRRAAQFFDGVLNIFVVCRNSADSAMSRLFSNLFVSFAAVQEIDFTAQEARAARLPEIVQRVADAKETGPLHFADRRRRLRGVLDAIARAPHALRSFFLTDMTAVDCLCRWIVASAGQSDDMIRASENVAPKNRAGAAERAFQPSANWMQLRVQDIAGLSARHPILRDFRNEVACIYRDDDILDDMLQQHETHLADNCSLDEAIGAGQRICATVVEGWVRDAGK